MKELCMRMCFIICLLLTGPLSWGQEEKGQSIDQVTKKLEKVNQALSKKLNKINEKLEKKLLKAYPEFEGMDLDSLLEAKTAGLNLEKLPPEIQEIRETLTKGLEETPAQLEVTEKIKGSLSQLDKLEELYQGFQLPELSGDKVKVPNAEVPDFKSLLSTKELDGLKAELTSLNSVFADYKKQFEGWEDELLARVLDLEEVKLLQEQHKRLASFKPLPDGYMQNIEGLQTNDFVKDQLANKVEEFKKVGNETLQDKFDMAQDELSRFKGKFPSLESTKNAPKRPLNPYANQPFLKRLKFGGNVQVNQQTPRSVDLAVQVSYLINPNARVGIAATDRIALEKRVATQNQTGMSQNATGLRGFFDYTFFKSFYGEVLFESARIELPSQNDIVAHKKWVRSGMIGLGKRFSFNKKIGGNVVLLYKFLHSDQNLQQSPWVLRVGFEL